MYERLDDFVDVFRAAHPHLDGEDRAALAEMASLWASRAIVKAAAATQSQAPGAKTEHHA